MEAKSEQETAVTLWNYTIDFNQLLGDGQFGSVYALIPRPANEQHYFVYCLPYLYDYWYCSDKASEDENAKKYCIKIFRNSLGTPSIEMSFRSAYWEIKNNELLI